jgi:hypothetical protein
MVSVSWVSAIAGLTRAAHAANARTNRFFMKLTQIHVEFCKRCHVPATNESGKTP